MKPIYLDNDASTLLVTAVLDPLPPYFQRNFGDWKAGRS